MAKMHCGTPIILDMKGLPSCWLLLDVTQLTVDLAKQARRSLLIVTFDPHPLLPAVLAGTLVPALLVVPHPRLGRLRAVQGQAAAAAAAKLRLPRLPRPSLLTAADHAAQQHSRVLPELLRPQSVDPLLERAVAGLELLLPRSAPLRPVLNTQLRFDTRAAALPRHLTFKHLHIIIQKSSYVQLFK